VVRIDARDFAAGCEAKDFRNARRTGTPDVAVCNNVNGDRGPADFFRPFRVIGTEEGGI